VIAFRLILFPVDFSDHTRAAAPSVKAMAEHFGAEIVLLHVNQNGDSESRNRLEKFAAQEMAGARTRAEVRVGDSADEVVQYALDNTVDLIMMPTRGHSPFRALLLGSVTTKVLEQAECPVWTGVHAEESIAHPPSGWKRLVCAVDDSNGKDLPVLRWAAEFAQLQEMDLLLVHAVAGAEGMWTKETDGGMYEFLFDAARGRLEKLKHDAGTAAEIRLVGGSLGAAVHRAAVESQGDLIVIGRGSTQRLRSNAYAIIRQAPCPVISI
jgi:nucleotide-binding universal stress UspA family protein